MTRDQVTLLVAVDGFVLAVLLATGALLWGRPAGEAALPGEPELPAGQRLLVPLLDGLRSLGMRMSPSGSAATMQRRLDIAGNPQPWTVERVFAVKTLGLLAGGVLGLVLGHGLLSVGGVLFTAGFAAAGFFLPDVLVHNAGIKRQQRIQTTLSDVVDLLSVTMKAGLGFDGAVARVAQVSTGPLSAEFARYLQETRLGQARGEALRALAARSTVVDLHHVVSALVQADQLGIPVAKVLGQQAHEVRLKRRQRAQEKAQKVTIKLVFPTLLCIFPALFVVVIGPGVIQMAQTLFGSGGPLGG